MIIHRIYSLTSIGRPVDWKYPTNRAMVILLLPAALAGLAMAWWQGDSFPRILLLPLITIIAAFGGWALGRELDPDNQSAAFVALVIAVFVVLFGSPDGSYRLLLLFTVLGLVRQVNRTTGLQARLSDSILLLALTVWVIYATENPLFGLVAAASFALDGSLELPLRRQYLFALLSVGATIVYMVDHDIGFMLYKIPRSGAQWMAAVVAVVFALHILLFRSVSSVADVNRRPLDASRVRGGMAVAVLAVFQGLPQVQDVSLIAATIAGISLAWAFRRSFSNPAGS